MKIRPGKSIRRVELDRAGRGGSHPPFRNILRESPGGVPDQVAIRVGQ